MEKRLWLKGFQSDRSTGIPDNRLMHPLAAFVVLHKHEKDELSIMFAYASALGEFKKALDAETLDAKTISMTYTTLQKIQDKLGRRERAITHVMALLLSQTTQSGGGQYGKVKYRVNELLAEIGVDYAVIESQIKEMFGKMSRREEFYKPWTPTGFKVAEATTGGYLGGLVRSKTTKFFDQNAQKVQNPLDTVYFDL